jgi:hypothetical protein
MKHIVILLAAAFACAGCADSNEGLFPFDFIVDYAVPQQTVPGDPILALLPPQELPEIPIPIDLQSDSDFNSRVFDHLTDIEMQELVFTIDASSTDPAVDLNEPDPATPDDWSFLTSVEIWIEHPVTLQRALVALINAGSAQLQPGVTTLRFICGGTNLIDYFDSCYNTTVIVKAVGKVPEDDVVFNASANFRVTAVLIK